MTIRFLLLPATLACATLAAAQTPPAAPNPNARFFQALTGVNAINTASIVYSGLGTAVVPGAKKRTLQPVTKFTVAINYGMQALRMEIEELNKPKRVEQFLADGKAWDVIDKKTVARPDAVAERVRLMFMTPQGVMKAAQDAGNKRVMANEIIDGTLVTTMVFPADGAMLKAYLDDSAMIARVHTMAGDATMGKTVVEFLYTGYKDHDPDKSPKPAPGSKPGAGPPNAGIPFPSHIVQKIDGEVVLDIMVTEVTPNVGLVLEVPPSVERASGRK
ncbi:MAG: hypothetical protein ABL971_05115 [Vicinamibacterales bacterium]